MIIIFNKQLEKETNEILEVLANHEKADINLEEIQLLNKINKRK